MKEIFASNKNAKNMNIKKNDYNYLLKSEARSFIE